MKPTTMIRIKWETRNYLKVIGKKDESYDTVIQALIQQYKFKTENYFTILKKINKDFHILCQRCLKLKGVHIHHRDINPNNNTLSNLEILCRNCHMERHHPVYKKVIK